MLEAAGLLEGSGLQGMQAGTLVLIVLAGFAAGWVDAVVGGGDCCSFPRCYWFRA